MGAFAQIIQRGMNGLGCTVDSVLLVSSTESETLLPDMACFCSLIITLPFNMKYEKWRMKSSQFDLTT
jgi:hypothetical protein